MHLKTIMQGGRFRYFITFCLLAVILVTILGATFNVVFSRAMREEAEKTSVESLGQLMNAQQAVLREVENSFQMLLFDPWIYNAMDYYRARTMSVLQTIKFRLNDVCNMGGSIQSLCAYYIEDGIVLSSDGGFQTVGQYADGAFLMEVERMENERSKTFVRKIPSLLNMADQKVVTFVKQYPIRRASKPSMLLFINIRASYIEEVLESIMRPDLGATFLFDGKGNDICGVGYTPPGFGGPELLAYLENAAYEEPSMAILAGRQYMAIAYKDRQYDWTYLFVQPITFARQRWVTAVTAGFCLFALIVGVFFSWILSQRIYRPIRRLSAIVRSGAPGPAHQNVGHITEQVASLIDRAHQAEALISEHRLSQRNQFLREFALGELSWDEDFQDELAQYGIDMDPNGRFIAFCVAMDRYSEYLRQYTPMQKNLHRIYEQDQVSSCASEETRSFCVEMRDNETLLLCQVPDGIVNFDAWSVTFAQRILDALIAGMQFTYTIGMSRIHEGPDGIPACYQEASFALSNRLFWDQQKILRYSWLMPGGQEQAVYPLRYERELIANLKISNVEQIHAALDAFHMAILGDERLSLNSVRSFYIRLYYATMQTVELDPGLSADAATAARYERLYRCGSAEALRAVFEEHLNHLIGIMDARRQTRTYELIDEIKRYIAENLSEDLSTDRLAERFYISASYLRKLFKQTTGQNIKEYSCEMRLLRAEELLSENMLISNIAAEVGYASSQAFISAFKQARGISPGQYRKNTRPAAPEQG